MPANPFEGFVQEELGKRPYSQTDGPEETILVRRGPGPRQLSYLVLQEGQIIGLVNGVLTGIAMSGLGGSGSNVMHTHKQPVAAALWSINHGLNHKYFTYNVYDATGRSIWPDEVNIIDENNITISFLIPTSGHVVITFDPAAV